MLYNALHLHHHQNTNWKDICMKNSVYPFSIVWDTCRTCAKMHWICVCGGLTPYTFSVCVCFSPCHSFVCKLCSFKPQRRHLLLSVSMAVCGITLPFWSLQGSDMSYCHAFCVQDLCVWLCKGESKREFRWSLPVFFCCDPYSQLTCKYKTL